MRPLALTLVLSTVGALGSTFFSSEAWAQAPSETPEAKAAAQPNSEERARAEKLFEEASALMAENLYASACPKLEGVIALVPQGIGAHLRLADCYEALGRLASAHWALSAAVVLANHAKQEDRAKATQGRLAELEPRVGRITLGIPASVGALPQFRVLRNGVEVPPAEWNKPTLVDPGDYKITATAEGRKSFEETLSVAAGGRAQTADVRLPEIPKLVTKPLSTIEEDRKIVTSPWSGVRVAGVVVGGLGLGLSGVGLGVGLYGEGRMEEATDEFTAAMDDDNEVGKLAAENKHEDGYDTAVAGWAVLGVGGAVTVAGVIMAIAAPSVSVEAGSDAEGKRAVSVRVVPWVSSEFGGVVVDGAW